MGVKLNRSVDRVAKLTICDFDNNNLEKIKANVLNKGLGVIMIVILMENFNINISDIQKKQQSMMKEELDLQRELLGTH